MTILILEIRCNVYVLQQLFRVPKIVTFLLLVIAPSSSSSYILYAFALLQGTHAGFHVRMGAFCHVQKLLAACCRSPPCFLPLCSHKISSMYGVRIPQDLLLCAMLWWHHLYLVFFMIYLFYTNLDNLNLPANSIASLRGEGEKVIEFSCPSLSYRLLPLLCRICKKKHSCIFVFPDFGQQASNNRRQFLGAQHNQICSLKTTQHFQKEEE